MLRSRKCLDCGDSVTLELVSVTFVLKTSTGTGKVKVKCDKYISQHNFTFFENNNLSN